MSHAYGTSAWLALLLLAASSLPARAAMFCVDSVTGLTLALGIAEENGEADEIRIVSGNYLLSSSLFLSTHEAFAATISGRWNAACNAQNGALTVLDGQTLTRILHVNSDALSDLTITDLYFTRAAARALLVETSGRNVVIERNLFVGNRDASSAGAARIAVSTSNSRVTIRNNVVLGNSAPEGGGIAVNAGIGEAWISGNTIVGNTATMAGALCGGLCIAGGSDFTLSNNILWGNGGGDLFNAVTATTLLFCNDVGTLSGQLPDIGGAGNLSVLPGFAPGLLNLRLAADSPLVNAGCTAFGGGGDLDVARDPRRQGRAADLGAYETDVLFRNSFDR